MSGTATLGTTSSKRDISGHSTTDHTFELASRLDPVLFPIPPLLRYRLTMLAFQLCHIEVKRGKGSGTFAYSANVDLFDTQRLRFL